MRKSVYIQFLFLLALLAAGCGNSGPSEDQAILVSTGWVQSQMQDPDFILLQVGTQEGYDTLHIPGARLILPADYMLSNDSVNNELPPLDSVVHMLRKAGVNQDSRMLLYYESERMITRTARLFMTLEHAGLGPQTSVMNGGLPAWLDEDRETTDQRPDISMGDVIITAPLEVTISSTELDQERWSPGVVVIDARTPEEYHGTPVDSEEDNGRGHVEGAYSLPYQATLMEDRPYLFKTDAELETLFRDAGMDPEKTTVVYCGSGVRASASYLTARQLGYPVLLYDGSYQEWDRLDLPLTGPVESSVEPSVAPPAEPSVEPQEESSVEPPAEPSVEPSEAPPVEPE